MKKILSLLLISSVVFITSCSSLSSSNKEETSATQPPVTKESDTSDLSYMKKPIVLTDEVLIQSLDVTYIEAYDDKNQRQVQVNIKNKTLRPMSVSYRIEWFDHEGFRLDHTDKKRIMVPANDYFFVRVDKKALIEEFNKRAENKDQKLPEDFTPDFARIVISR
ncbi:MAG: DUF1425 domain-containing protein [Lentisphaeria bacterium]|nr:DUF1425 domain-containing protein [Lentisphaeria bacterium]